MGKVTLADDQTLSGRQMNNPCAYSIGIFIGCTIGTWASFVTIIIHNNDPPINQPWIEKLKTFQGRFVKINIDMYQTISPSLDLVEAVRIWVTPKPEYIEVFEKAARTPGMLMSVSK